MRFRIFDPITPVEEGMPLTNLGHLFNAYSSRLHSLEVTAYPQESLREYHRLTTGPLSKLSKADREKARVVRVAQERFYCLAVLNNSLHDLHLCVVAACNVLGELFTSYDGDLLRYAIENRLKSIARDVPGTDEELQEWAKDFPEEHASYQAEWEPTAPGQPYRVVYKDDAESIAPYSVLTELAHYFAPLHECDSIETIGNSLPQEFAYFTEVVREYSQGHKTSHIGDLTLYRANTEGQLVPQSFAQRVENEVNDELKDQRVASHFLQILRRMHYVAGLSVMLTDSASYRELWEELVAIRDCADLYEPSQLV